MAHGVVYKVTDTKTGFLYIGKSVNFKRRMYCHVAEVMYHFNISRYKAKQRFNFDVIYISLSSSGLSRAERFLINYFNRSHRLHNTYLIEHNYNFIGMSQLWVYAWFKLYSKYKLRLQK